MNYLLGRSASRGNTSSVKNKCRNVITNLCSRSTSSDNLLKEEEVLFITTTAAAAGKVTTSEEEQCIENELVDFQTARDALPPDLSEMLSSLSEESRESEKIIQLLKVKLESKRRRFRFWKKATSVLSWSVYLVSFGAVLTISILVPNMAPVATICSSIVGPLDEFKLSFLNKREAKITELETKTGRVKKFWREDMDEWKLELDKLIEERDFDKARKALEEFQKEVVEINEEFGVFIIRSARQTK